MKKTLIIILILLAIGSGKIVRILNLEAELQNEIVFEQVDMNNLKSGDFSGLYKTSFIEVAVTVHIENSKIMDITINKHVRGKGKPAEVIVDDIIKLQQHDVDIITGATASSKVIIKAVENALIKALK